MPLVQVVAAGVVVVSGGFGFVAAGWVGVICASCVVLAIGAAVGHAVDPLTRPVRARASASAVTGAPYPRRYQQYQSDLESVQIALADGRYFAHVLAPKLQQLAVDVCAIRSGRARSSEAVAQRIGIAHWRALSITRSEREDAPSEADVDALLAAIEAL